MVDFVKALKRPFSDTNRLFIGTLLGMIPLVNLIVTGYALRSTGFTKEKMKRDKLPEWKNYSDLFIKGLVACFIGFLLFLPAILFLIGTFGTLIMSPAVSMFFGGISMDTWSEIFSGDITEIQAQTLFNQDWTLLLPFMISALPLFIIGVALAFLALYVMPIATLGWLKEERFSAAFSWKVLQKAFNFDYFVNWLVVGFLISVVGFFFGWIPFLGTGITMYVIGVFSYTVFAEVYESV